MSRAVFGDVSVVVVVFGVVRVCGCPVMVCRAVAAGEFPEVVVSSLESVCVTGDILFGAVVVDGTDADGWTLAVMAPDACVVANDERVAIRLSAPRNSRSADTLIPVIGYVYVEFIVCSR